MQLSIRKAIRPMPYSAFFFVFADSHAKFVVLQENRYHRTPYSLKGR